MTPLEQDIGYTFKDTKLLRRALRHPSMEHDDNQRLEFLGDAVLEYLCSDKLYAEHPDAQEGELTHLRQLLVCETALSQVAKKIRLGDYLTMDRGEDLMGGRENPSILCDTTEALLAAIYLDGGMEEARRFYLTFWPNADEIKFPLQDSKGSLQELLQKDGGDPPVYTITGQTGTPNAPSFTAMVSYNGKELGRGEGRSKKQAEKAAALDALTRLGKA